MRRSCPATRSAPLASQLMWQPFTGHVSSDGTLGWLTGGYANMNVVTRGVGGKGAYFSVWKHQADGTWRVWLDEGISLPSVWQDASPFRVAPEPDGGPVGNSNESMDAAILAGSNGWPVDCCQAEPRMANRTIGIAGLIGCRLHTP